MSICETRENAVLLPMKSSCRRQLALALAALLVATGASAQSWAVAWHAISGGGGTSTGGDFALSGSIGQPAADGAPMTGGNYSLTAGFWALYAVQTAGAPWLSISRINNNVVVSWASGSTNWLLQQNTGLGSSNWLALPDPVITNGTSQYFLTNPPAGNRFNRLLNLPAQ